MSSCTTRRALFEQLDRPALQSLPPTPYEYADWKRCRVNLDYHIEKNRKEKREFQQKYMTR